jgi:glycosyltransferase involved in cell wall biosynthesis
VVVNYGLNTTWERSSGSRRRLLGASLRAAATVVCLGESQRRRTIEQAGLRPERVRTVLLGIDERYFARRPPPAAGAEPYVLAVGKDLARDYRSLVEAVRPLGVRTEIAGYARNVEGISLPRHVRARSVPVAELRELYAGAACVVVPQYKDGFPYGSEGGGLTSVLETLAMARPLVASNRPILDDYLEDGSNALVVPPEEPDVLRQAIERVLGDAAAAARLGAAGRERVEARLTTRHFAEGIAPILREAVSRTR